MPGVRHSHTETAAHSEPTKADNGPSYIAIGRVVRPRGRRGEVFAEILTDFPERFDKLESVLVEEAGRLPRSKALESAWFHKSGVVLKFKGVDSIEAAEQLRGLHLFVPAEARRRLPIGSYYFWELVGCKVVAGSEGREIGVVSEVEPRGETALLHVESASGECLIPFAEEICREVNLAKREIVIEPPEGLLELNHSDKPRVAR